jgi:hypothetical protein
MTMATGIASPTPRAPFKPVPSAQGPSRPAARSSRARLRDPDPVPPAVDRPAAGSESEPFRTR